MRLWRKALESLMLWKMKQILLFFMTHFCGVTALNAITLALFIFYLVILRHGDKREDDENTLYQHMMFRYLRPHPENDNCDLLMEQGMIINHSCREWQQYPLLYTEGLWYHAHEGEAHYFSRSRNFNVAVCMKQVVSMIVRESNQTTLGGHVWLSYNST